jgi:N-acetylmuramoyl-L-alanine amidase
VRWLLGALLAVVLAVPGDGGASVASAEPERYAVPDRSRVESAGSLSGRVVVIDPGHQLGNARFPRRIARLVPAGGFKKPCNTTGTSTNGGFPEATFNWKVARLLQRRLERRGARVILTRDVNSRSEWGPCVDRRGRAGNRAGADLKISIHADGRFGGGPGFHVIAPPRRRPWTHDIHRPSFRVAKVVRARLQHAGLPVAGYTSGGDGLDIRRDLATLNLSDVPTVMVELGNMRDRRDARRMTSDRGRSVYARALAQAAYRFLR